MTNQTNDVIRDAKQLGIPKMLILGLQHMFAMFGATILVPILVNSYFTDACGEGPTHGLTVAVTLFCAGFGTLLFHVCSRFQVPAFLGSSFAFLGGFSTVAKTCDEVPSSGSNRTGHHLYRTESCRFCDQQCFHQLVSRTCCSGRNYHL